MDILEKRKLAHEHALAMVQSSRPVLSVEHVVISSWAYADAMEAQENSRIDTSRPDVLFEPTEAFDKPWSPDWSKAPRWAKYWAQDDCGLAFWYKTKPMMNADAFWDYETESGRHCDAPTFNFKGNWRNSLRERP